MKKKYCIIVGVILCFIVLGVGIFLMMRSTQKKTNYKSASLVRTIENKKLLGLINEGKDYLSYSDDSDDRYLQLYDITDDKGNVLLEKPSESYSHLGYRNYSILNSPNRELFAITDWNRPSKICLIRFIPFASYVYTADGSIANHIGNRITEDGTKNEYIEYSITFSCDGKSIIYIRTGRDFGTTNYCTMIKNLESGEEESIIEYSQGVFPCTTVQLKEGMYLSLVEYGSENYANHLLIQSKDGKDSDIDIEIPETFFYIKNYSEDRHTFLLCHFDSSYSHSIEPFTYYLLTLNKDFTEYDLEKFSYGEDNEFIMSNLELSSDGSYMIGMKQTNPKVADYVCSKLFLYNINSKEEIEIDEFNDELSRVIGADSTQEQGILLSDGRYFAVNGRNKYYIYRLEE